MPEAPTGPVGGSGGGKGILPGGNGSRSGGPKSQGSPLFARPGEIGLGVGADEPVGDDGRAVDDGPDIGFPNGVSMGM